MTLKQKSGVKPYSSNLEYISAGVNYLTILAHRRLSEARLNAKEAGIPGKKSVLLNGKLTNVDDEDVSDSSLASLQRACRNAVKKQGIVLREFRRRTGATIERSKVELPLEDLARTHNLTEFEKMILLLLLAPLVDNSFRRLIYRVTDTRSIEVRTVLDILCDTLEDKIRSRRCFVHNASLLSGGLLNLSYCNHPDTENDFLAMDLEIPRRISSLILGAYDVSDELMSFSSVVDPYTNMDMIVLPEGKKEEVLRLIGRRDEFIRARKDWGIDRILSYGKGTIMLFSGPSGTGKTMLAHALAHETGHRLMLVDFRKVRDLSRSSLEENLGRIFHEARLQHAIVFFDEADEMFSDRFLNSTMPVLLREFEKLDGIAILATNRGMMIDEALERRILYKLEFDIPTPELREKIWERHLPEEMPLADDISLGELAEEFEFSGGFIKNAVLIAVHVALQRSGSEQVVNHEDLRRGARMQLCNRMETRADRIIPKVSLDDVILPMAIKLRIEDIVRAARKRSTVFSTWGFGKKLNTGKAISVLFSGESGVGKTMCAEAVAYELGQNLYPVRISSIISKYVGDTAKNLRKIFNEARNSQSIIFFDEADAFFSSRIEDGSHHAHYINQEITTLLREMEKFDGIVILATNRPESFDPAFERRLRHRVDFPHPDAKARKRIWRSMMPENAPVEEDLDFAALAGEYDFTGGTIRNVTLRAAFAAATDGGVITGEIMKRCAEEEGSISKGEIGFSGIRSLKRA